MKQNQSSLSLGNDIPSSIVVFFVALPLCLGIAHGSNAPTLMSGVIAGIIGGIVVGLISGSKFGVSGPAAGLMTLVAGAIVSLGGSYETFLVTVILAGIIQILLGVLKLGFIAYYFPNSVIKGMLAGIGVTIVIKQIPHAVGYDRTDEGAEGMFNFGELVNMLDYINYGAIIIALISLGLLILFQKKFFTQNKILKYVPGSFVAVIVGVLLNQLFAGSANFELTSDHLVNLGNVNTPSDFVNSLTFPDFSSALKNPNIWMIAFTIAIVASLETLLSVEATDKLDPDKNLTPTNRELIAQGSGNVVSGLIGGLPITQVIVRSSANISSGAKSKWSTVFHGLLLLTAVLFIPALIQRIPLSALAAVLLLVGYKLASPKLFVQMYRQGWTQFIPFIVTVVLIYYKLLVGVTVGLILAFIFILYRNFAHSFYFKAKEHRPRDPLVMHFSEHITFLNKASIIKALKEMPDESTVTLDLTTTIDVDQDIWDVLNDFRTNALERKIQVNFLGLVGDTSGTLNSEMLAHKKELSLKSK